MFAANLRKLVLSAAVLFTATTAHATTMNDLAGVWTTDDGQGAVEFFPCGEKRCGRIVWLKNPRGEDGKPVRDLNNPNKTAREKTVCELNVVANLEQQKDGTWDKGTVYDPNEGETYSVAIKILPNGNLEVMGYMGSKIFSETMIWTRRAAEFEHCQRS